MLTAGSLIDKQIELVDRHLRNSLFASIDVSVFFGCLYNLQKLFDLHIQKMHLYVTFKQFLQTVTTDKEHIGTIIDTIKSFANTKITREYKGEKNGIIINEYS